MGTELAEVQRQVVDCPEGVCISHEHVGSCIICEAPAHDDDCAYITAYLCNEHLGECNLLDPSNAVTVVWDRYNEDIRKRLEIQA